MDIERDPPKRPKRIAVDVLLVVAAIVALSLWCGLLIALEVVPGTKAAIRETGHYVAVMKVVQVPAIGLPPTALLLLAASLTVRSRRR